MLNEINFEKSSVTGNDFLAVQFRSEILAIDTIAALADDVELVDFVSHANGALSVFFRGKNLEEIVTTLKKKQKKNFICAFYKKRFPLDILKVFYYLHKPKKFSSLIFAEVNTIPETLALIEACLELNLSVAEVRSQRVYAKNMLVIGADSKNFKNVYSTLKKNFKKVKWAGCEKPNESLLRMFILLEPN